MIGKSNANIGILVKNLNHAFEEAGEPIIVRSQESAVPAPERLKALIEIEHHPQIFFIPHIANPSVIKGLNNLGSIIRGRIIQHSQLETAEALIQNTLNGFFQSFCPVVCRNSYANGGNRNHTRAWRESCDGENEFSASLHIRSVQYGF